MSSTRCPCLSGLIYGECCGRLHRGEVTATTAVELMRSRFSAFAISDAGYLLRTWHPRTRPPSLQLDPGIRWYRLDVISTTGGGLLDDDGTVEFRAHYREAAGSTARQADVQQENSRFQRVDREWYYLDAEG
ncbi:YchJ family protein [Homoserinimonas sp. OAct 916]|uniref:YchJ family protein n=1 Tax=Homoserinimonas sp. OAct 916 TaxID=2211450 RepID=UPI000DBE7844|nr:YchJ family metal-binding protein [Homoserinimonas sp. OAct 916]